MRVGTTWFVSSCETACDRMTGPSLRARRPGARAGPGRCGLRLAARTAPAALFFRLLLCGRTVGKTVLRRATWARRLLLFPFQFRQQSLEIGARPQRVEVRVFFHFLGVVKSLPDRFPQHVTARSA